ncbi:F-type H+-transporting ATPase subunit b [Rhodobacteraceae bacterium MBR-64]
MGESMIALRTMSLTGLAALGATPVAAASGPFFSLGNTNFVVSLAFLLFLGVLVYFKVPGMISGLLDKRADGIRADLDEARALRDEAHKILAEYERRQKDVQASADRIVARARDEAQAAAEQAKADIAASAKRRLQSAEDQILAAEASAVQAIRDRAVSVAIAAAGQVLSSQMTKAEGNRLIDDAIDHVGNRLN